MFDDLLGILALVSLVPVLAGLAGQAKERWSGQKVAERLKSRARDAASAEGQQAGDITSPGSGSTPDELRSLHLSLFGDLASLSLGQFTADAEARSAVEQAIERASILLNEPTSAGSDKPVTQIEAARQALREGDVLGGLARARIALEFGLGDAARHLDLPNRPRGPGATLQTLLQYDLVPAKAGAEAVEGLKIANRAVHGQPVDADHALRAVQAIATLLDALPPVLVRAEHRT